LKDWNLNQNQNKYFVYSKYALFTSFLIKNYQSSSYNNTI